MSEQPSQPTEPSQPTVAPDGPWHQLAPAARTFWTISALVPIVVLTGSALVVALALGSGTAVVVVGVVALGLVAWARWLVVRRWNAWRYAERARDLVIERGVLVRRITIVPYGRMQFVDVTQGPLDRWLGLSTVTLHTAAAATDATIPLLTNEAAERLRDRLLGRGDVDAAGL